MFNRCTGYKKLLSHPFWPSRAPYRKCSNRCATDIKRRLAWRGFSKVRLAWPQFVLRGCSRILLDFCGKGRRNQRSWTSVEIFEQKTIKKKICIDKTSIATLDLPANKNICCNSILAFKVARRTVNNYTPTDEEF